MHGRKQKIKVSSQLIAMDLSFHGHTKIKNTNHSITKKLESNKTPKKCKHSAIKKISCKGEKIYRTESLNLKRDEIDLVRPSGQW